MVFHPEREKERERERDALQYIRVISMIGITFGSLSSEGYEEKFVICKTFSICAQR